MFFKKHTTFLVGFTSRRYNIVLKTVILDKETRKKGSLSTQTASNEKLFFI